MKRIIVLITFLVLAFAPVMFAQSNEDGQDRPAPPAPNDVIGPQLIAWSELQEPKPVSQPVRPSEQGERGRDRESAQTTSPSPEKTAAPKSPASQNAENPHQK
jgi:hypothetical protein